MEEKKERNKNEKLFFEKGGRTLSEKHTYNDFGSFKKKEIYSYRENGSLKEKEVELYRESWDMLATETYYYREDETLERKDSFDSNGRILGYIKHVLKYGLFKEFNRKGYLKETSYYREDGTLEKKDVYDERTHIEDKIKYTKEAYFYREDETLERTQTYKNGKLTEIQHPMPQMQRPKPEISGRQYQA
jgi:hypothetical protein